MPRFQSTDDYAASGSCSPDFWQYNCHAAGSGGEKHGVRCTSGQSRRLDQDLDGPAGRRQQSTGGKANHSDELSARHLNSRDNQFSRYRTTSTVFL